jgi:hypothetical protein
MLARPIETNESKPIAASIGRQAATHISHRLADGEGVIEGIEGSVAAASPGSNHEAHRGVAVLGSELEKTRFHVAGQGGRPEGRIGDVDDLGDRLR